MSDQREPNPNNTTLTLAGLSGPKAYHTICDVYHLPLTWDTFVRTLTFPGGGTHLTACLLLAWCLSWYNVRDGEEPAFCGKVPYLASERLARDWGISRDQMKRARRALSRAGLVVFESKQRSCLVHVKWDAVSAAVRREAEFRGCTGAQSDDFRGCTGAQSESRGCTGAQSESLRGCTGAPSKRLEGALVHPTLLHSSPSKEPPSPATPEEEGESNAVRVARMLDYGRKAGRSCKGKWVKDAYDAYDAVVADGKDPDIVEVTWHDYVDEKGATATDLGHWLRGLDLRGKEADEGEWAFERMYEHLEHAAALRAEREGGAADKMPKPNLVHTPEGWFETRKSLVVADKDATREEAEAAWPEVWRRSQAS